MHVTLALQPEADVDDSELDELTAELRQRLLEDLDVCAVDRAAGPTTPDNAKSADATTVGALLVALSPITLRSVFQLVREWLRHRPVRTARIAIGEDTIELSGLTGADQRRLIDSFIERHADD